MPEEHGADRPSSLIGAVDNVLRLLALFETNKVIRVNEVSRDMGLSRSTVHRMLSTLHYHRFVEQDDLSRAYRPGPALVDIGLAVVRNMDIRAMAHAVLVDLAEDTGETVHLGQLRGTDVIFLDSVESSQMVRAGNRVGWSLPAHATASGKALLAALPESELATLYPDEVLETPTPTAARSKSELLKQLADTRARGYAINHAESEGDIGAVGAAVSDGNGRVRGALAVTAPISRVDDAWIERCGAAVARSAETLGKRFG
ncbi:DNA-binding IclR family transcriptional regulator [Mycobacterium sp. OAS707]|uniref:IclR family transcriptional regulator n=1 Tax=Mycobacterium sp. OAS707 TaxID=2663822 RepID=UPI0017893B9B|nr:IclR family transcriptional regulator [Mycobacterium sp. OAS707]MBE1549612.1 DNA-binding IclR family transcriptional regulator [Mycobacterium sp. OAS707]